MKILIIQEAKDENFREALCLQRAFNKLRIKSIVWGLNYPTYTLSFEDVSKDCNVLLLVENYDNGWLPNLSSFKGLKLFWSIDSHCVIGLHSALCIKHNIDIVLNSIESHSKFFKKQCYYLANAYSDDVIYYKPEIKKTINVGFCGNWANRANWINCIPNIKKDISVRGEGMVNSINSYKIHFNRNIADDINYRTFETLGCKTFLLTNETENLSNLFAIGTHLQIYTTQNDLIEKINYYLNNDQLRNTIAENGYKHVKKNHTYLNRAERILKIINNKLFI
jgi:spore maturation protein CgeB